LNFPDISSEAFRPQMMSKVESQLFHQHIGNKNALKQLQTNKANSDPAEYTKFLGKEKTIADLPYLIKWVENKKDVLTDEMKKQYQLLQAKQERNEALTSEDRAFQDALFSVLLEQYQAFDHITTDTFEESYIGGLFL
jgi:hypothetical protein